MGDVPGSATELDIRTVVLVAVAVVVVAVAGAALAGVDLVAVANSEALFPTTLAAFVALMVVVDWYRRR